MIDITDVVLAILGVIVSVLSCVALPYLKTKIGEQKYKTFMEYVKIAVTAAEQIFRDTEKAGMLKKEYVLEYITSKGFSVDDETIENAIESAVYELKNA